MAPRFPVFLIFLISALSSCSIKPHSQQQVRLSAEALNKALASQPVSFKDSVITLPLDVFYSKGKLKTWIFGQHYRDIWATPVKIKVLDLATEAGGLTPKVRGGGMQTRSLTLKDKDGHEWVLRSVDKDPASALPMFWRKTFLSRIVRDQTAASYPYGALIIPKLAQAVGIYHTTPKLVYIPHDKRLGEFLPDYAGMVALLESKPEEDHPANTKYGPVKDIVSSYQMLQSRYADPKHLPDQREFAKARIFDVWVGDWDRHEGQWRWAAFQRKDGTTLYKPIPRDRDQVFHKIDDGPLSWLLTRFGPLSKLQTFDEEINNVEGYARNSSFIDRRLLNSLTMADWESIADTMQSKLTDSVIHSSLKALPPEIYQRNAPELSRKLITRRKQLNRVAKELYLLLAKKVEVVGTDKSDYFELTRLTNGSTEVKQFETVNDGNKGKLVYQRIFSPKETKNLKIHGLRGEDYFSVNGQAEKAIEVSVVGGMGIDHFTDASEVNAWGKHVTFHDTKFSNIIKLGPDSRKKLSKKPSVHAYDQEGF
jgi:hypothetical protein